MSGVQTNRYALLQHPGLIQIREVQLPPTLPRPDFVRLKVDFCSICGGDLATFQGKSDVNYPHTLGHEYCGSIALVGESVSSFHRGEKVAVDPNYRCGQCKFCKSGLSNFCVSNSVNLFNPRGFAHYVDIHHSYLHQIPDFPHSYLGALIEPLSCALHALKLSKVQRSDRILILGGGGQGTLLSLALSWLFPKLKIEVYDPNRDKLRNLAAVLTKTVYPLSNPPTLAKYSLVFEASGQAEGFDYAVAAVQNAGRIIVSSRYRGQNVHLPEEIAPKGCTIKFSNLNGDGSPFTQAIQLLASHWREDYNQLITIESLSIINDVFTNLDTSQYGKTIIQISRD